MDKDFKAFMDKITGFGKGYTHKVRNSYGVYDTYKWVRKNKWFSIGGPVTEHDYYTIIRSVNNHLAENLSKGISVLLPEGMGKLELRKRPVGASIVDGKLQVTYPIAWMDTMKLWYKDEEAYKNKYLVRNEAVDAVYRVLWLRKDAMFTNKTLYQFQTNHALRQMLKANINAGITDTPYIWREMKDYKRERRKRHAERN